MTHRLLYSPRSLCDLEKIHDWIDAESGNPMTAEQFVNQLLDACDTLKVFPSRFAVYPYAKHWKMMPFGSYLIFFQVTKNEVRIGHIRHGARKPFGPRT